MKRDMDLIRRIVLAVEDLPHRETLDKLEGVDPDDFALHAEWLAEAGLIKATINSSLSGTTAAFIHRLTWDGCEFASSVRSDTLWKKAKESVLKPTGSFTFSILREWVANEIIEGFPALRGEG